MTYPEALKALNDQQRKAVEAIDGPLLVLAGPGTGKTQLLSVRVAHILATTDTLPSQILCLTFTESGVRAMRQRLTAMIGDQAYEVRISTYHAFGRELLSANPDHADIRPDAVAVDDLTANEILKSIITQLPFRHPLKLAEWYLSDVRSLISEIKRAGLSPEQVQAIAADNLKLIDQTAQPIAELFDGMRQVSKKELGRFVQLLDLLTERPEQLADQATSELAAGLEQAEQTATTKPITAWKNRWLIKDEQGRFNLASRSVNLRLAGLAEVYASYQTKLQQDGYFDYDDMILRAIDSLQRHPDFLFNLQEQYQYFLLDEFQDTNGSQLKLIELLTNNPVNEGRPNVMAVGDDDQAIFAFQGANYSNMRQFLDLYLQPQIISLETNYRSHPRLVELAHHLADKVESRLHHQIAGVTKLLTAAMNSSEKASSELHEFASASAHYQWIADKIAALLESGVPANEVAVLAPKHKYFDPLLAILGHKNIAVSYEKRDNIFDQPFVKTLINTCRLINALTDDRPGQANALWPMILSHPMHQIPVEQIWQISWDSHNQHQPWLTTIMSSNQLSPIGKYYYQLALDSQTQNLEVILDRIIGLPTLPTPLYEYYFGKQVRQDKGLLFWQALSALKVLRQKLRDYLRSGERPLLLTDFLRFVDAYQSANFSLTNTSPITSGQSAVQIMTAYKAKGLEFDHVFVIAASDEVWGMKAGSQSSKIALPPNLEHIRYAGASSDERARLLYVAITRARRHLYMAAYANDDDGTSHSPLRYLTDEKLPLERLIAESPPLEMITEAIEASWHQPHLLAVQQPSLKQLLADRLSKLRTNATQINNFTDIVFAGPESVLTSSLLRFPSAPSNASEFGNAVHELLKRAAGLPKPLTAGPLQAIWQSTFGRYQVTADEASAYNDRGLQIIDRLITTPAILPDNAEHEVGLRTDQLLSNIRAYGKIDCLVIDKKAKAITVIDYKTGLKAFDSWRTSGNDAIKARNYANQLMFYKLLVEAAPAYQGYQVTDGQIIFLEADDQPKILDYQFDANQLEVYKSLIRAVWQHLQDLSFPDVSAYSANIKGIAQFEADLISGQIKNSAA